MTYAAEYDLDGAAWKENGFHAAGQDHSAWMMTFIAVGGTRCKAVFPRKRAGEVPLATRVRVEGPEEAHVFVQASPVVGVRVS